MSSGEIGDRLMRLLTTSILLTICINAIGQTFPTKKKESWDRFDTSFTNKDKRQKLTYYPDTHIHTEWKYADSTGIVVIIQNSFPEGAGYTDSTGKTFGGRIFWTRVINETSTPLELTINFPADSFPMLSSSDSYLKLFLLDKESLYRYGAGINKPTMLQRTINPKEACLFYIGLLFLGEREGVARAELILKEQELFYRMNLLDSALIPCGQIVFNK